MKKVNTGCLARFQLHQRRKVTAGILQGCLLLLSITPCQFSYGSGLPPFPNASLRLSADEERQNHPVITSRMKRVNGVVTSDGAKWLDGHLNRALYLLPAGHSGIQGYDFYVNKLHDQGVEPLFQCQSFSCGASNFWANDIFDIPTLYGQDKEQAFFIGKKQGSYYSVYSVRRGNGRVYTLVDVFKPHGPGIEHVNERKKFSGTIKGTIKLPVEISSLTSNPDLTSLVVSMNRNPAMNVLLIIHSPVPETLAELNLWQQQMEALKKSIKKHLNNQGINDSRLHYTISADTCGNSPRKEVLKSFGFEIVPLN